jgi:hypothetical protein
MKKKQISTKNALIDLYLTLKYYQSNKKSVKKEEDLEYLTSLTEIDLIKYIKDSLDCTILSIVEKKINDYNKKYSVENIQQDYESMLIKYEKDIRGHIKTEHQLKLFADSLQDNIEDLEKQSNNNNYKDIIDEKNNIIKEIKNELNYNKKLLKSLKEKNKFLEDSEKKLKNLFQKMEKKYKNDLEILSKKLEMFEAEKNNKKSETIYCNSSRRPNNSNIINNYIENSTNRRIFRNSCNNISIGNNHSTSLVNTRPYEKIEKYILNTKYPKNNKYQYKKKIKNLKSS